MASRRCRIRPVANVPVRRGKVSTENTGSDVADENLEKEDLTQSEQLEISNTPSVQESETPTLGLHSTEETNKLQESISDVKAVMTASNSASSINNSANSNEIPSGLVRKRMKPAVSIAAVTRRPRDSSVVLSDFKATFVNCNRRNQEEGAQQNTVRNGNISDAATMILPCYQKGSSEVPFCGVKDGGIGVPGITQIIPTGTAIRPQHDGNVGVSSLEVKGDPPQSLPEPDLPSEGAGGGYSSVVLRPSSPQVNIIQSSCILGSHKFVTDSVSKSDDSRKTQSSDSLPFCNNSEGVVPEHDRPRPAWDMPNVNDKSEGEKQGSGAHSSETESELKSCMSDASIRSPSVRKTIETSRGRFVRPAPRFSDASVRRGSTQSMAGKSEEFRKGTSIVTSPHKKQADLVSEESVVAPSDSGCLEEGDKAGIQLRHAPSSGTPRLARARQEFLNKFKNKTPDRSCLTMFDLIFYNPTTNPMKHADEVNENSKIPQAQVTTRSKIEERLAEEQVDEPMAEEQVNGPVAVGENNKNDKNAAEEEDNMAMPVPQVKVGPNGQIILDEKSLVIETTGARKSREDLANSAVIVDYGTGSAGYGTYSKKHRKSRDWSKEETLKFYRALHTVGTDFLLMQSIFPKRTRHDLKTKFKREDRTNRFLVEKALRSPLNFDLTELEKELEKEEEEERQALLTMLQKKNVKQRKAASKPKGSNHGKVSGFVSRAMDPGDTGVMSKKKPRRKRKGDELNELCNQETFRVQPPGKAGKTQLRRGKNGSSSSSDENERGLEYNYSDELKFTTDSFSVVESREADHSEEASDNDMEELEYLKKPPKPTRSGRVPQRRRLSHIGDDIITVTKKSRKDSNILVSTKNIAKPIAENQPLDDLTNVEPGSLVVLATQSPTNPGHQVFKVFMVAPKPAGLPNTALTMPPLTVPLTQALLPPVIDNTPSSQLSGESQPSRE